MNKPRISVAIPCYEMGGVGAEVLERSLDVLCDQTFKDFEVVIADHSVDDRVMNLCSSFSGVLNMAYCKNSMHRGSPSANTNTAMGACRGDIIKLLCQDDYLASSSALQVISDNFDDDTEWLFTSYVHTNDCSVRYNVYTPRLNDHILTVNTLGTPSALSLRNHAVMYFDTNLVYMFDCEYYKRMLLAHGEPKIIGDIGVVNYLHANQVTKTLVSKNLEAEETRYILLKHGIV